MLLRSGLSKITGRLPADVRRALARKLGRGQFRRLAKSDGLDCFSRWASRFDASFTGRVSRSSSLRTKSLLARKSSLLERVLSRYTGYTGILAQQSCRETRQFLCIPERPRTFPSKSA